MANTPKSTNRTGALSSKTASGLLSASEALHAAESAIEPTKARRAKAAAAPIVLDPVAVRAASALADAAPEPLVGTTEPITPLVILNTPDIPSAPVAHNVRAEGNKTMNDVIENGRKFAEDAKAKLETAYAGINEKAKVGVEKSTRALEEMSDLTKGNVEALVESGKIAAKAMETIGQDAVEYSRKHYEKATATIKSFSTVKTPTEFFQLHSQLFASAFDDFSKQSAHSSETFLKLATEVAQPLTARVTIVTDKIKSLAA